MALAHGIHLQADLAGAGNGEDAQRLVVEDERVGVIVGDDDSVAASEIYDFLQELARGGGSGRHMGIIHPHQLNALQRELLQGLEIGLPAVFLLQVVGEDFRLDELADGGIRRISRVRNQDAVAGVEEGQGGMENPLLRTDERKDFALGVEGDAIAAGIPVGHRAAHFGDACVGLIAVGIRAARGVAEGFDDLGGRHAVGASDAQGDDVAPLGVEPGDLAEFAREIVFLYGVYAVGGVNRLHFSSLEQYSPRIFRSLIRGRTASIA